MRYWTQVLNIWRVLVSVFNSTANRHRTKASVETLHCIKDLLISLHDAPIVVYKVYMRLIESIQPDLHVLDHRCQAVGMPALTGKRPLHR